MSLIFLLANFGHKIFILKTTYQYIVIEMMKWKMFAALLVVIVVVVAGAIGFVKYIGGPGTIVIKNPDMIVEYTIGEPKTLDPADAYDTASCEVVQNVYDRLVTYKGADSKKVYPSLATSWTNISDGKIWTFNLRHDVKFSNGNAFTAEDVKYSLDRVLIMNSPESGVSWILSQFMDKNSTKVIDDYTVEINLTQAYGGFLPCMAFTVASIVDKETVQDHGGVVADTGNDWMKEHSVGTGPYMLDHWTHMTEVMLVKNPNYWGGWEGKHVSKVVIKSADEAMTRVLALKSGDADFAYIPIDNIQDVKGSPGIYYESALTYNVGLIILNTKSNNQFMNNSEVRKALSYAFDYNSTITDIFKGYGIMLPGCIPKGMPYYETQNNGIPIYNYNLTKAGQILDAAGFTKGAKYRFEETPGDKNSAKTFRIYYNAGNAEREKMAVTFQSELTKLDIVSSVTSEGWPQLLHRMYSTTDWDMIFIGWMPDYNDPDDYVFPFVGSADIGGDTFNTGWKNETVDDLIMKAKYEVDTTKRAEYYKGAFDIYINDPSMIFIDQSMSAHFHRDWIRGYVNNPVLLYNFYDYYKA